MTREYFQLPVCMLFGSVLPASEKLEGGLLAVYANPSVMRVILYQAYVSKLPLERYSR